MMQAPVCRPPPGPHPPARCSFPPPHPTPTHTHPGLPADDGLPYLSFSPDQWMSGYLILQNTVCNSSGPVPELRTGGALQFEFRGTPSTNASCGPPRFNVGKWTSCGRNNVSKTVDIPSYIDQGAISATEWRKVTIPMEVLLDNAGLQPCDAAASWNLDRQHYGLYLTFCPSCAAGRCARAPWASFLWVLRARACALGPCLPSEPRVTDNTNPALARPAPLSPPAAPSTSARCGA